MFNQIRAWGEKVGLYDALDGATTESQYIKLGEEMGELAEAILKRKPNELKDAIGDMVVVLTHIASLNDLDIEDCIQSALDVINKRTGVMKNRVFLKD